MMKNNKGNVSLYFAFIGAAIIIIVIAGLVAPIGVLFNTEMFQAGEDIMLDANESVQNIQNDNIRAEWQATMSSAIDATDNNIEVNSAFFQYGWIFILVLSAIVAFLFARRLVEFGGGLA